MHTFDAIRNRRAVKHYDPDHVMDARDEALLRDLIRQSPSSFNIQHARYVTIRDKDLRAEVRKAAWDQAQVTDASLLFVVCADIKAWSRDPERYWESAPPATRDWLVGAIHKFYDGNDWQQRDEAMRSIGLASQTLMLAAKSMGYDTCPMIGFDAKELGRLINLPPDHVIGMVIAVGKGIEPARPKGGYIPEEEAFIEDRFPDSYE